MAARDPPLAFSRSSPRLADLTKSASAQWLELGINNPPPLTTTGSVALTMSLGDLSTLGSPVLPIRAVASSVLVPIFGGFGTVELESGSPGGVEIVGFTCGQAFVGTDVAFQILDSPFSFSGATVASTVVATGIGQPNSTVRAGVNATVMGGDFFTSNVDPRNATSIYVPPGSYLAVQTANTLIGVLSLEWVEFPEAKLT